MYIISSTKDNTIFGVYTDLNEAQSVFDALCNIMSFDCILLSEINKSITSENLNAIKDSNIKEIDGDTVKLNVNNEGHFNLHNWMREEGSGSVEIKCKHV